MVKKVVLLVAALALIAVAYYGIKQSKSVSAPQIMQVTPASSSVASTSASITPSASSNGLANPASVNCGNLGGKLSIQTRGDGGQYGVCDFGSGYSCEEWALYRGDCPKTGVKTTGFDTKAQIYCAQVGGKTLAVANATCTFPNGKSCPVNDLFNGKCQATP